MSIFTPPAAPSITTPSTGGGSLTPAEQRTTLTPSQIAAAARSAGKHAGALEQEYIAYYKLVLQQKPNMKLIHAALKGAGMGKSPLILSEFEDYVRQNDPHYMNSEEARQRSTQFLQAYSQMLPGQQVPRADLEAAVRSGEDLSRFYERITQSTAFQKANPTFNASGVNLPDFEKYTQNQNAMYAQVMGRQANDQERAQLFSSKMTPADFENAIQGVAEGSQEAAWSTGQQLGTGQFDAGVYGGSTLSNQVRQQLTQADAQQKSYFNNPNVAGFGFKQDNEGNITQTY